jgi:hypothetical protein
MTAANLLDRLSGVRLTAPGRWLAKCPAHPDKSPSLSVRELDDGTVLVKCWAGCGAADVVAAAGLQFKDLFPARPGVKSQQRQKIRVPATDILITLDHEAHVVAIIAADVLEHREIDPPTWGRLAVAVDRIGAARAQAAPLLARVAQ